MAPPKGKTEAAAATGEEPPAKKAKAEEGDDAKKEEIKVFEEPDAPKDTRAVMKEKITFPPSEMTLNAVPTLEGKLLMAISDGGMAYLMAGARASVAQKAGRYMFEAKIVQTMNPAQSAGRGNTRQMLRIGFSTAGSTLMLGDDDQSICFDADGSYISEKKRQPGSAHIYRSTVVGVVLNLDEKSPNYNTVTLYCEGKKMSEPKPLPEGLKGKALFPHICYRSLSVHVNFGPAAMTKLPFDCRMLAGAAQADVVASAPQEGKDGKYEVVLPVAFPDEGTFDWLDAWLEKNPKFVELSDRKIIDWARCSGFWSRSDRKVSNDKPNFNFGVPDLDDLSVRKLIGIVAPIVPRNYVVMEVKSNLTAGDRKQTLKKFTNPCYKKVAQVVMGEPDKDFKGLVHSKLLKEKQDKSDHDWRRKKSANDDRLQRLQNDKQRDTARREAEEVKRKAQAEKKAKAAEEKAKAAEEKAKAAEEKAKAEKKDEAAGEEKAGEGDAEKKDEPAEDAKAEEETKKDEPAEEKKAEEETPQEKAAKEKAEKQDEEIRKLEALAEELGTAPPAVELSEEEKATTFLPKKWPDLSQQILGKSFSGFSTPAKDEGFDDIRYEWDSAEKANAYLKEWVTKKKLSIRMEDLKPGEVFTTKVAEFGKLFRSWQDAAKSNESKVKPAKAKGEGDEEEEELDAFKVDDIMNTGEGLPLFQSFEGEDWALVQLRSELHLLVTSFIKDCDDPDRTGIPIDHVSFYFYKYFNKMLNPAMFGMTENKDLLNLVKDTVTMKDVLLVATLEEEPENFDIFVKMTEASRRDRARRIEAGDETARLKFSPNARAPSSRDLMMGTDGGERDGHPRDGHSRDGPSRGGAFVPYKGPPKGKGKGKDKGKDKGKFKF